MDGGQRLTAMCDGILQGVMIYTIMRADETRWAKQQLVQLICRR